MKLDKALTLLVARVMLVMILVMSGYDKVTHLARTADFMGAIGMPFPGTAMALLAGVIELAGGILVLVGWKTRPVALGLAVYLLPVTWFTHLAVAHATADATLKLNETFQAFKSFAMAGGLLLLSVTGPGLHAVDRK